MSARPSEPPVAELPRLAQSGATGELVCVCPDLEVHVYLQSGRIAWATSSAARLRFSRELEKRGVDTSVLREVLDHCRVARAPVGETLVAWGAASLEDVREALRLQIEDAVGAVADAGRGRTLFLPRGASGGAYDVRFTFELPEVLRRVEPPEGEHERRERDARLRAALPDVRWIGEHRQGRLWPARWPSPRHEAIAREAFTEGADFLAMRLEAELLVGLGLADDRGDVWLGLPPTANVGTVLSALAEHVRPSYQPPAPRSAPTAAAAAAASGTRACPACLAAGASTLERFAEVRAIAVSSEHGTCVVSRTESESVEALEVARRNAWLLAGESGASGCACSLALGIDRTWWFAGDVPGGPRRQVWIGLDRMGAQGVGWALTATLVRELERRRCEPAGAHASR